MDQNTASETPVSETTKGCINCSFPIVVEGYPNRLCESCRENFIKFPIPKWIKAFGAGVLIILLYSMISLPKTINVGVQFAKGKNAFDKSKYLTAQRAFEKVCLKEPNYIEGKGYLMISAFYNQDFEKFIKMYGELESVKFEDDDLFAQLTSILNKAVLCFPNDSLSSLLEKYSNNIDSFPDSELLLFVNKNTDDIYAKVGYASRLIEKGENFSADSILSIVLQFEPDYQNALIMKSGIKREIKQYDSSHYFCDKLISLNQESSYGLSSKARTYLKQKSYSEGLSLALKVKKMDVNHPYNLSTLVIAYHLNKMIKQRDELLKQTDGNPLYSDYMTFAKDVISGKEKFID